MSKPSDASAGPVFATMQPSRPPVAALWQGGLASAVVWFALSLIVTHGSAHRPGQDLSSGKGPSDRVVVGGETSGSPPAQKIDSDEDFPLWIRILGRRPAPGWAGAAAALLEQFDSFDVVALGEWHGNLQDFELRLVLIQHPEFAKKVRFVVIETASARHQSVLDRFVRGEDVKTEELRPVWRDITTPGGADAPVYEALLHQVRRVNRGLPKARQLRVLAADPPVDWSSIEGRAQWREIAARRDEFAAGLIEREVLNKQEKALVIVGSGHLWQKNQLVKEPNLATLLKQRAPGKLYTVSRLDPQGPAQQKLASLLRGIHLPVLLTLRNHAVGLLSANEMLGVPVPLFGKDTELRDVVDAGIYSGISAAPAAAPEVPAAELDPAYEAEKTRRRKLIEVR